MKTITATIDGVERQFGAIGFEINLEAEECIRQRRKDDFRSALEAVKELPTDLARAATLSGFDMYLRGGTVDNLDVQSWLDSPSGEVHVLSVSLRRCNDSLTDEEAHAIVKALPQPEFLRIGNWIKAQYRGENGSE